MGSSKSKDMQCSPTESVSGINPNELEQGKFSYIESTIQNGEFIEGVVCKENDLKENEMKVVDLGGDEGGKVLLVKQKGKIYALGTKCSHYGAPLVNGHLGEGRIRCQWHGACFNILNGDIEDFPGLDSLPCYEVKIAKGNVRVRAKKQLLQLNTRVKPFVRAIKPNVSTYIVVGGGPAGANCVETLRQEGYEGRLVFVMEESYLPYDRVKLSKTFEVDAQKIALRSADFYGERNVELAMGTKLLELNPEKSTVSLSNGQTLNYNKIFLATGSKPKKMCCNGSNLKNIFVLRTIDDAVQIAQSLTPASNVVVLGTSFIGMEAAAYCSGKVNSVTVVGRNVPFKTAFGEVIGIRILQLFAENNIEFQLYESIEFFEGKNGVLTAVELSDGTKLPCDICLVGIGVTSNTEYLNSNIFKLGKNGTVEVNEFLQSQFPDVYAGGDIASAPVLGHKASIGHWGLANYHGHIAALNMLNKKKPLKAVPFFWTMFFGKTFRYAGFAPSFDDVVIDGSVEDLKFIAFYCVQDHVAAVVTIARDPLAAKFAEMLYEGKRLEKNKIQEWLS